MKPEKTGPNEHEKKVFGALRRKKKATIREIARECFPGKRPVQKADSWVRNSLRFWVDQKKAKKVERGTYAVRA